MPHPPKFVTTYFKLIAVITVAIGLSLLLWPEIMHVFFDHLSPATAFMTRIAGCTLVGYATLNALAAWRYHEEHVLDIVVWANLTTLLSATLLCILARHSFDHYAWLLILEHALFSLGFVYCLIAMRRQVAQAKQPTK